MRRIKILFAQKVRCLKTGRETSFGWWVLRNWEGMVSRAQVDDLNWPRGRMAMFWDHISKNEDRLRGQKAFSSNDLYFLSIEDSRIASSKAEEGRDGEDYLEKVGKNTFHWYTCPFSPKVKENHSYQVPPLCGQWSENFHIATVPNLHHHPVSRNHYSHFKGEECWGSKRWVIDLRCITSSGALKTFLLNKWIAQTMFFLISSWFCPWVMCSPTAFLLENVLI